MAYHGATKLALGDVNLGNLQDTKNEIVSKLANVQILLLELDVTSESSVDQGLQKAAATFARVDYAVNNAGISGPFAPTENVAP